jgi:hypothetical protein
MRESIRQDDGINAGYANTYSDGTCLNDGKSTAQTPGTLCVKFAVSRFSIRERSVKIFRDFR